MISTKMTAQVREELIRKIEELRGALHKGTLLLGEGEGRMADLADRAAAEHDRSVEAMIQSRASDRIWEIRETIRRIDQGLFGICSRCGAEISVRRLKLAPSSRLCAACMHSLETGPGRPRHPFAPGIDRHAA